MATSISGSRLRRIVKPIVFLAALIPFALLVVNFATGNLSANPLDDITDATGTWTLRFIVLTLAVTPLQRLTGWSLLGQLRRMLGLFAFFYVCLHFTTYIWFDKFFEWEEIIADVAKRPFIAVGFTSFVLLIPLAVTSWNRMIKWIGGKNWKRLHRLVYVTAIGGVVHYLWLVKADTNRPLTYGAIVLLLFAYRIWEYSKKRMQRLQSVRVKNTTGRITEEITNSSSR